MKKLLSIVLTILIVLCAACANADSPPITWKQEYWNTGALKVYENMGAYQVYAALEGHPTEYRRYDVPAYEAPCGQPGQVVKLEYKSRVYGETYEHYVNIYLPYGYDENGTERYPILYFFHGLGHDQSSLLGRQQTVNVFDHMTANGEMPPCIIVAASYFYDNRVDMRNVNPDLLVREMREELMPMVEGTYRTYAETPDEAGFTASRGMRAICGYSYGSLVTWRLMQEMLDYARTFLPFSYVEDTYAYDAVMTALAGEYADDWFLYMASGLENDTASAGCILLSKQLLADQRIRFGTDFAHDNFFYLLSDNFHEDDTTCFYLYNAFLNGLFRE